jgi:hypothetical protein
MRAPPLPLTQAPHEAEAVALPALPRGADAAEPGASRSDAVRQRAAERKR